MSHTKHHLLLGAHMSIAGGFEKALERGESIGCTAIQIFTKSNRQWAAKPITTEQAETFKKAAKNSSVLFTMAHASYLINLGSADHATAKKSAQALIEELERCAQLGIKYLTFHPGSGKSANRQQTLEQISDLLNHVFENSPTHTTLLLENMAGQGSVVCSTFEEIALIRKKSAHKARLLVCFDTCHAFAAGYDFTSEKGYKDMWHSFDALIGLEHLKAIHTNDSKKGLGQHVDRHEHIGKGKIGLEAFTLLLNDPNFFDVPKILETPKDDGVAGLKEDLHNMDTLKDLISAKNKKILGL